MQNKFCVTIITNNNKTVLVHGNIMNRDENNDKQKQELRKIRKAVKR